VGELPDGPENEVLRVTLGTPSARAACALPITYENRTVLLLYGEGARPAALAARRADLTRAAIQASLALQLMVLRNRLLDM
jgi:GAF domain-containing protein